MTDNIYTAKRGRPRKFDRQKGIETATSLFWKSGYDGLGIAQLCSELNITPTSLYGTYKNKYNLFTLVVENYKKDYVDTLQKTLADCSDVSHVFRNVLDLSMHHYTQNDDTKGCLILDSGTHCKEPGVVQLLNDEINNIHSLISERLAELNAENGEELAAVIITLLKGMSAEARSGKSSEDLFITMEFLCATFGC